MIAAHSVQLLGGRKLLAGPKCLVPSVPQNPSTCGHRLGPDSYPLNDLLFGELEGIQSLKERPGIRCVYMRIRKSRHRNSGNLHAPCSLWNVVFYVHAGADRDDDSVSHPNRLPATPSPLHVDTP